jgi:hypothetical protein
MTDVHGNSALFEAMRNNHDVVVEIPKPLPVIKVLGCKTADVAEWLDQRLK